MSRLLRCFAFVALCTFPLGLAAQQKTLKLGTIAPQGSVFHKILVDMGAKWAKIEGAPQLRIYAGGITGGEADMVMKMKIGQIDAALITANGLSDIDPAVQALQSVPMLYRSLDEVQHVTQKLRPKLDKRIRDKGFVVLFWGDAGWVHFFAKNPVVTPNDLKKEKIFTWAGDTEASDIYKSFGFTPVSLETSDILPMLRTGMISAVPLPPTVALTTQTFSVAKNMNSVEWAPLSGALIVTERAWNRFPPAAQAAMAKAAAEAGAQMLKEQRAASTAAIEAMKKRGLKVHQPSPQQLAEWRAIAEKSYPKVRGGLVPAEFFDEVTRLLSDYRKSHPPAR